MIHNRRNMNAKASWRLWFSLAAVLALVARAVWGEPEFSLEPVALVLVAGVSLWLLRTAFAGALRRGSRWAWSLWLVLGTATMLYLVCADYRADARGGFYLHLTLAVGMLILVKNSMPGRAGWHLCVNTLVLWVVGLVLIEAYLASRTQIMDRPVERRLYSFEAAHRDPAGFRQWWNYYTEEWSRCMGQIAMPDPRKTLPFRLKPGSRAKLFDSEVAINSRGFRDEEFALDKGGAYRIVVLGESTTMGCTLAATDRPWPKVLAALIASRMPSSRKVQVINAGVAAYDLKDNLFRLAEDILPLAPDLIVSYHGFNGFKYLGTVFYSISANSWPKYVERPMVLLARAEYGFKCRCYARQLHRRDREVPGKPLTPAALLDTRYAHLYEQLIEACRTNHIRLALASFNLAVKADSDREVIEFYRSGFPNVYHGIEANAAHNQLLACLVEKHPGVRLIDTRRQLDGAHDKYIDLVHFTQAGRDTLATNVLLGIDGFLRDALAREGGENR